MNHVQWRYIDNHYRKFCSKWFIHWFDLRLLWWDIVDAYQRAMRGWADGDIYDFCSYHSGVTLGLLKHFKEHHNGWDGSSPEEYEHNLDAAISAWQAEYELMMGIHYADPNKENELREQFKENVKVFDDIYDSIWI